MCWFCNWPYPSSVKLLASGDNENIRETNKWYFQAELARWNSSYNLRYVVLVELLLSDGFSLHQRSEDGHGTYGRRTGDDHQVWKPIAWTIIWLLPTTGMRCLPTPSSLRPVGSDESRSWHFVGRNCLPLEIHKYTNTQIQMQVLIFCWLRLSFGPCYWGWRKSKQALRRCLGRRSF